MAEQTHKCEYVIEVGMRLDQENTMSLWQDAHELSGGILFACVSSGDHFSSGC